MSSNPLDQVRGTVLDRIERRERQYKMVFLFAAVVEAAFLLTFLVLADLANRLHLLLLLSTVAVYGILALGLIALGVHVSWCAERVIQAIEASQSAGAHRREEGRA